MTKKAYFYIDDVIWVFRDITRQKPKSLFDNPFLKLLKTAHEKYDFKVQLNLFWRTDYYYGNDEFTLAETTDAYKAEWEAASDWLKLSFHAKQEFPDYPHINATYDDIKTIFENIRREVIRFAGEKSFTYGVTPHWGPMSLGGVQALYDCGVRILWCSNGEKGEYNGDPFSLPYGHAMRLLNNRQPETGVYSRGSRNVAIDSSLAGYNHITTEQTEWMKGTFKYIVDEKTGMGFKKICCISPLDTIPYELIESDMEPHLNDEYFCMATHEQYFYSDYLAYQPEYPDKIYKMCEILKNNGYEFFYLDEIVK